jgi:hypothetical protein
MLKAVIRQWTTRQRHCTLVRVSEGNPEINKVFGTSLEKAEL